MRNAKLLSLMICVLLYSSSNSQHLQSIAPIHELAKLNLLAIPELGVGIKKEEAHNPHFKHLDAIKPKYTVQASSVKHFKRKPITPTQVQGFKAQTPAGTPLDNNLAISNDGWVVSAVNQSIRVFDTTGKFVFGRSLSAIANALGTLNRTFDPHIMYDPDEDKFVLVFLNGSDHTNTNLIVGFSESNDPAGDWHFYKVKGNITGNDWWSDYPFIGLTKNHLLISVLLWEDGDSGWDFDARDENVWVIGKAEGYQGDSLISHVANELSYGGKPFWNIRPVKGGDRLYADIQFITNRPKDSSNDTIFLIQIDDDLSSGLSISIDPHIMDKPYGLQPNVSQKDGRRLRTNYCDIHEAYRLENDIYFVSNSIDFQTQRPGIYVGHLGNYQMNQDNEGFVFGVDSLDLCYPSIAYAGGGWPDQSAMVLTLHNSQHAYPGSSSFLMDRDFLPGDLIRLKAGEGQITVLQAVDSLDRWGDYTGIQRRFNRPGEVWAAGSFGTSNNTSQTWISQLKNSDTKLGLQDDYKKTTARIYPNPGKQHTLEIEVPKEGLYKFSVYNAQGQVVWDMSEQLSLGNYQVKLNLGQTPGIYFVEIKLENSVLIKKKIVHQ